MMKATPNTMYWTMSATSGACDRENERDPIVILGEVPIQGHGKLARKVYIPAEHNNTA